MPPLSAVAMDLSGILIEDIQHHNLRQVAEATGIPFVDLKREFHVLFGQLLSHSIEEDEFWSELEKLNPSALSWSVKSEFLRSFRYRDGAEDFLRECSGRLKIFAWTNMPATWVDALDRALAMDSIRFVNGYALYWPKPHAQFFQYALDAHGLAADDVLYVSTHRSSLEASVSFTADRMLFQPGGFNSVRERLGFPAHVSSPVEPPAAETPCLSAPVVRPKHEPAPNVYIESPSELAFPVE